MCVCELKCFSEVFWFLITVTSFFFFFPSLKYRNIFLGETFSSYISVHNDSNQVVKDILVKVCEEKSTYKRFIKK